MTGKNKLQVNCLTENNIKILLLKTADLDLSEKINEQEEEEVYKKELEFQLGKSLKKNEKLYEIYYDIQLRIKTIELLIQYIRNNINRLVRDIADTTC